MTQLPAESTTEPQASAAEITTFTNDVHGYLRQNVTWADQKAGFLFVACSGMLAYLHSIHALDSLAGRVALASSDIVVCTAAILLVMASASCVATYWPRTAGRGDGLVFWKAIAGSAAGQYMNRVRSCTADDLVDEKIRHTYELARVCVRKFRWTDAATKFGSLGLVLAAVHVVFLA